MTGYYGSIEQDVEALCCVFVDEKENEKENEKCKVRY
jgi:hypothetical protein